jgi:hypothetical protein
MTNKTQLPPKVVALLLEFAQKQKEADALTRQDETTSAKGGSPEGESQTVYAVASSEASRVAGVIE